MNSFTKRFLMWAFIVPLLCNLNLLAQGVNTMSMRTVRNFSATKDWATDTAKAEKFGASTMQIIGYYPTGRQDIPYQRLVITINGFTGKAKYSNAKMSATYFEDIFSNSIVKTDYLGGDVDITEYTENPLSISGTFGFILTSKPPTGSNFRTEILNGKFAINVKNAIKLTFDPVADKKQKGTPGDKIKWTITARDKDDALVEGADIYCSNKILGTTDTKVGTTGANGTFVYEFKIPEEKEQDTYQLKFVAKKTNYEDGDPVTIKVSVESARYYFYKCAGVPIYVFDAGEGKTWKGVPDTKKISSTGTILINSFLKFDGSATIDTSEGAEKFGGSGKLYIPDVELPGSDGAKSDYVLIDKSVPDLELSCTALFDKGLDKVSGWLSKVMDIDLKITKMRFTNTNEVADGIELAGKFSAGEKQLGQCNDKEEQLGITLEGSIKIQQSKLRDLTFAIKDFGMGPGACLKNAGGAYTDNPTETFVLSGAYESKVFGGLDMSLGWKNKYKTDPMTFSVAVEKTLAPCKPIPDTPFCLEKVKLDASCNDKLQLLMFGLTATAKSDEQILKDKYKFNVPVVEQFAEIIASGKYEAPFKVTLSGTVNLLKIPSLGGTSKPWQYSGTNTFTLDVSNNYASTEGPCGLGNLGGDTWFFEISNQKTQFTWSPAFEYTSQSTATVNLPDLSDSLKNKAWVKQVVKWLPTLPSQLGTASYYLKNTGVKANIDVSNNPVPAIREMGTAHLSLDLSKNRLWDMFEFGAGTIPLWSAKKGDNVNPQSPQEGARKAQALQSFNVPQNVSKVLVFVFAKSGNAPVSSIITPAGVTHTKTATDSSVIMFTSPDNSTTMWSLRNPSVGEWKIACVNPTATDSIDISGIAASNPFAINASATNRVLSVTWDGTKQSVGSTVDVFLDTKNSGTNGILIGSASAQSGSFTYTLTDSLKECSYFVYATVSDNTSFTTAYASNSIENPKNSLAAPSNIVAVANQLGATTVTWNKTTDNNAIGYYVFVRNEQGVDSLYATLYAWQTTTALNIANPSGKKILLQTFNDKGWVGCPAVAQGITVFVQEEERALGYQEILAIPNPAQNSTTIRFANATPTNARILVSSMLGEVLMDMPTGTMQVGEHSQTIDTKTLASGTYIVRVVTTNGSRSTILSIHK